MRWIVVGAGAAGCAVAATLARRPDAEVTLVEAGPAGPAAGVRSPSFFDALAEPGWTYPGPHRRGRGLGGSSAVNGMLAGGGPPCGFPVEVVGDVGPVGRALLAAAPDAAPARLVRHGGVRVTAADRFLSAFDGVVRSDTEVATVMLDGTTATGVATAGGGEIEADRVVLAAGAIGTPALLLRSGVTTPGVGAGLRNHAGLPILLRLRSAVDVHATAITATWRRGAIDVVAVEHLGPEEPGWAMLLAVVLVTSTTGTVSLDDADQPAVSWVLDPSDRARLSRAALAASGIAEHPAFAPVVDEVVLGDGPAGVFHWASTCAIGPVLDDRGAVHGHQGLYVADASAFPELPTDHLMLPTVAQAQRLAAGFT